MKNHNILVLTYWSFKEGLIQTYTLPYLRIIAKNLGPTSKIHLVTFEKERLEVENSSKREIKDELELDKIYWKPYPYSAPGPLTYISHVFKLLSLSTFIISNQIRSIHCFCTPAGSLGYILSTITRKRLVLDSFEPHAENMVEVGHWSKSGLKFKLLKWLENKQIRKAKEVILTTQGMYNYIPEAYNIKLPKKNSYVKPACVDLELFEILEDDERHKKRKDLGIDQNVVAVYAGKLGGIYYEEEVFKFLKCCFDYWDGKFSFLMLTNTPREKIDSLAIDAGLDPSIIISKFVLHSQIPQYMSLGDFGITPVRSVRTKRYCTPIKDGEYWALGLPVVITPNISDDSDIIEKYNIGSVVHSFKKEDIINSIQSIDSLLKEDQSILKQKIRKVALKYRSFSIADRIYQKIYQGND